MKLQDLEFKNPIQTSQKVFESYFGKHVNFNELSADQATAMLSRVRNLINEHRNSSRLHNSEKNPNYLKLMVMEQALTARVEENLADVAMKDPKTKQILQKAQRGQNLTPDEQKTVTALALAPKTEDEKKKKGRKVMESEVQQAQVVLAAQDMVDRIQDTLEDVTEMKFKDLPALVDSIRNEVGMNQAQQYMNDASAALDSLISCLQETKTSIEGAQGILTGQEPVVPGQEDQEIAPASTDELDLEVSDQEDTEEEPESDLEASLGRARR